MERTRVEDLAAAGNPAAVALIPLLDNLPRALTPVDFMMSAALLLSGSAVTWRALSNRRDASSAVQEIGWTVIVLLAGLVLGYIIGALRAVDIALISGRQLQWLLALASPVLAANTWLTHHLRSTSPPTHSAERLTSDDIQIIVAEGHEPHRIENIQPEEREMIAGIIEMGERTARDIMIPRLDVVAIEIGSSLQQVLDIVTRHGHSRLPIYESDVDHIIGILHVKDLLELLRHPDQPAPLRDLLRPVHYVPDTARADDLLRDLLRNRIHMAVVVDEYGGTVGVLTIEDALEEIVGEIRDEYDASEEPEFVRVSDDEAIFNARVPVGEVNEVMALDLPTEESDTLGGLIYARLGKMPKIGDGLTEASAELAVTAMTGRRIKKVRVRRLLQEQKMEATSGADERAGGE